VDVSTRWGRDATTLAEWKDEIAWIVRFISVRRSWASLALCICCSLKKSAAALSYRSCGRKLVVGYVGQVLASPSSDNGRDKIFRSACYNACMEPIGNQAAGVCCRSVHNLRLCAAVHKGLEDPAPRRTSRSGCSSYWCSASSFGSYMACFPEDAPADRV